MTDEAGSGTCRLLNWTSLSASLTTSSISTSMFHTVSYSMTQEVRYPRFDTLGLSVVLSPWGLNVCWASYHEAKFVL